MPKTAISFKTPPELWSAFKTQTDDLFLSRAPFLDYMIRRELCHLRSDLDGLKLSLRAKRHIAGAMKRMEPVSVNIEVAPETAEALRQAMSVHNLVRDAFVSRLLILLRSTDDLLKYLEVPLVATSRGFGGLLQEMPSSPLRAMEEVRDDPLFYVRAHVRERWGCGLYRVELPRSFDWAACYFDDEDVSSTAAYRRRKKAETKLFDLIAGSPKAVATFKTGRASK